MNRICIAALMAVMICGPGCGPEAKKPTPREAYEATQELLSLGSGDKSYRADYIRVLISEGADVNAKKLNGLTPMMRAVMIQAVGHPPPSEIVTLLIEAGADVNAKDIRGETPLSRATDPEIKKLLKAAGAKE